MRYFFDAYNGSVTEDQEGMECPSDEAAIAEAVRGASDMSEDIPHGGALSVRVRDAAGPVAVVTISLAIERKR